MINQALTVMRVAAVILLKITFHNICLNIEQFNFITRLFPMDLLSRIRIEEYLRKH